MKFNSDLEGSSVLVTGGGGCLGAWTVKLLGELGAMPIVYDLTENRDRVHLVMDNAEAVIWETGDITDYTRLHRVMEKYRVSAVIHLAALQVPFCKANPVAGAAANVVGTTSVFEAARQLGIARISYASSIAAVAMSQDNHWLETLYGAHKVCGEQTAAVYWQDWQVPSVGIRPAIVYGPGRDRGMSAAPTIAMMAAVTGHPFTVPFSGPVSFVHAEDAAARFVAAVAQPCDGALTFDLNGTLAEVSQVLQIIRGHLPSALIDLDGDPLPFPAESDDGHLDRYFEIEPCRDIEHGIKDTLDVFAQAWARGVLNKRMIDKLVTEYQ